MKQAGKLEEKIETYNTLVYIYIYIYIKYYYYISLYFLKYQYVYFLIFQTEKYNEVVNKISHLSNRLKEAQENSAKTGEFQEDSLDAFMSNLNTTVLSKNDMKKMKVELQNLRKEEINLMKLINFTKPTDSLSHIRQAPIKDEKDKSQQISKFVTKKIYQLEKRRKLLEISVSNRFPFLFVIILIFISLRVFFTFVLMLIFNI